MYLMLQAFYIAAAILVRGIYTYMNHVAEVVAEEGEHMYISANYGPIYMVEWGLA